MTSQIGVQGTLIKPLLEVRGLRKHFPIKKGFFGRNVGSVKAVDDVSFDIYPRETLGVVGESGCGKTTVGRTVLRLLEPTAGSVKFEGKEIFGLPKNDMRAIRRHMQIIFQDPYSSLNPRMTVGALIGDALELHGIAKGDARLERARELLERVGLQASYVNRYPHEFSGGQRQRIGIARAVALNPKFIVCDEAVSALDVSVQAQVLNLLGDLQDEYELSYMFIAHDLAVVRHIADRIAVMYLGRIVEMSTCEDLFDNPLHPYTQALLSAIPVAKPGHAKRRVILQGDVPNPINPPAGCHFHTRCPLVFDRCRVEAPESRTVRDGHRVACHLYENVDWPATPFSILRESPVTVERPVVAAGAEPVGSDVETSVHQLDDLFDGTDEGDPRPVGIPEILKDVAGMQLGPFGELVDPEDVFTRTSEVPLLERVDSGRTKAPLAPLLPEPATIPDVDSDTISDLDPFGGVPPREFNPEATGKLPPIHDDEGHADDVSLSLGDTTPLETLDEELPSGLTVPKGATTSAPVVQGDSTMDLEPVDDEETAD
jgi:oligopeptide transport system ATP-binding protein